MQRAGRRAGEAGGRGGEGRGTCDLLDHRQQLPRRVVAPRRRSARGRPAAAAALLLLLQRPKGKLLRPKLLLPASLSDAKVSWLRRRRRLLRRRLLRRRLSLLLLLLLLLKELHRGWPRRRSRPEPAGGRPGARREISREAGVRAQLRGSACRWKK